MSPGRCSFVLALLCAAASADWRSFIPSGFGSHAAALGQQILQNALELPMLPGAPLTAAELDEPL
eukprot:1367086-Prymnesium_polylepis.1